MMGLLPMTAELGRPTTLVADILGIATTGSSSAMRPIISRSRATIPSELPESFGAKGLGDRCPLVGGSKGGVVDDDCGGPMTSGMGGWSFGVVVAITLSTVGRDIEAPSDFSRDRNSRAADRNPRWSLLD